MMAVNDEKRAAADVSSAQESGEDTPNSVLQSGNIIGKLEIAGSLPCEEALLIQA